MTEALIATRALVALRHDENPVAVYLGSLAEGSRSTQAAALGVVAALIAGRNPRDMTPRERLAAATRCEWWLLRYQHVTRLRTLIVELGLSPATVNRHLAAVKRVLLECWRLKLMTAEEMRAACDVRGVGNERLPKGRMLAPEELAAMMKAAKELGARDAALFSLLYYSGMRRAEIVSLTMASLVGDEIHVVGKGNKERSIPIVHREHLDVWLEERGAAPGPLFPNARTGGHMTPNAVYFILGRIAARAGVENLSPHDMRRTFGSTLLDLGVDLATVQKLFGHADPSTTSAYDRRGKKAKAAAIAKLPRL